MDGVEVHTSLKAQQSGIALRVGVSKVTFLNLLGHAMGEDVVVDAIGKESQLCRDILRGEVEPEVGLQAVFCLKLLVSLSHSAQNPRAHHSKPIHSY